jgi:superoxide dismutase, Fe-Mn family
VSHPLAPIACKPWMLNGLSERLMVSHYENEYGGAVSSLNAIRRELDALDLAAAPAYRIRAMKREELAAQASVTLHELYFASLGGEGTALFTGSGAGTGLADHVSAALEQHFGGATPWRREFVTLAQALSDSPGWVTLSCSRRDARLHNLIASDHAETMIDSVPLLVLDMYEHAYHLDFGSNAGAYIDAFMRNIHWTAVGDRLLEASGNPAPRQDQGDDALPAVSVEELAEERAKNRRVQVIDARPKHYFSRGTDMMQGATWKDPDRIDEWSAELSSDAPVYVYCAYGFGVGCGVTAALRERGFDAKYVRGGLSAWYASGGDRALRPAQGE